MKTFQKYFCFLVIFGLVGANTPVWAKKKKEEPTSTQAASAQQRVNALSPDEKRQFEALSDHQQQMILQGKVEEGFNAWMVNLAFGPPFSDTTTHPEFPEFEQVMIYTKPDIKNDVREERFVDPVTGWPSIRRSTRTKKCTIGDFFVLFDREVVQKVVPDTGHRQHGSCTVETSEAIMPIVDGKPVQPVEPPR